MRDEMSRKNRFTLFLPFLEIYFEYTSRDISSAHLRQRPATRILPDRSFPARRFRQFPAARAAPLDLGGRGIRIRRERTRTAWSLHFTGRHPTSDTLDGVFDEIERLFSPPEERDLDKHLPPAHRRR